MPKVQVENTTVSIDQETWKRLTTGTKAQRQVSAIEGIDAIMREIQADVAKTLQTKAQRKLFKKGAKNLRKQALLANPCNMDVSIIKAFYADKSNVQ